MPALFRIVNDEHPPLPEGASPAVRDFLLQCFQKDPNLRVSARKLLKHPWTGGSHAKRPTNTKEDIGATTKFEDAVRSVQKWNEAIKSPTSALGDSRSTHGQGVSPSQRKTNLRAGVIAGVTMTPPKLRESVIDKQIAATKTDPFRSPEGSSISPHNCFVNLKWITTGMNSLLLIRKIPSYPHLKVLRRNPYL